MSAVGQKYWCGNVWAVIVGSESLISSRPGGTSRHRRLVLRFRVSNPLQAASGGEILRLVFCLEITQNSYSRVSGIAALVCFQVQTALKC